MNKQLKDIEKISRIRSIKKLISKGMLNPEIMNEHQRIRTRKLLYKGYITTYSFTNCNSMQSV